MSTAKAKIEVEFELTAEMPGEPGVIERLVRDVCREAGVTNASVSIRVVDDAGIIAVHQEYMGKDNTTDVISFDLSDEFEKRPSFAIVVNAAMAARQAQARGHSAAAELALYITHGLLHNLGYDDGTSEQAGAMHAQEDLILQRHGFGTIYKTKRSKMGRRIS